MFELLNRPPADPFFDKSVLLLSSAWPIHIVLALYLLFVLNLGKKYMANRKPYDLKNVILIYNIIQVIYNAIMFSFGIYFIVISPIYDLRCVNTLPFSYPLKYIERWLVYAYHVNKILDLMDTVFFVLRKSYKQITFLHVYHHVMMVATTYWVMRLYGFGGQYIIMGFLNTFVHSCMYIYYFLTTLKPEMKASLWWKKYLTKIQLAQFIILLFQALYVLIFNSKCEFPLLLQYMQLFQASAMIIMFGNFYIKTYMTTDPKKIK